MKNRQLLRLRLKSDLCEQSFYTKIKFRKSPPLHGFAQHTRFLSAVNLDQKEEMGTIGESSAELVRINHDC